MSIVAANPDVRKELRRRQREWAIARGGGVIEGRDIGSVVFPEAELKVYLTAEPDVRAGRRAKEVSDLDYETGRGRHRRSVTRSTRVARTARSPRSTARSSSTPATSTWTRSSTSCNVVSTLGSRCPTRMSRRPTPPSARPNGPRKTAEVHGATRGERLLYGACERCSWGSPGSSSGSRWRASRTCPPTARSSCRRSTGRTSTSSWSWCAPSGGCGTWPRTRSGSRDGVACSPRSAASRCIGGARTARHCAHPSR